MLATRAGLAVATGTQAAPTFVVNSLSDAPVSANVYDGVCATAPGNGTCTPRAASMEANASAPGGLIRVLRASTSSASRRSGTALRRTGTSTSSSRDDRRGGSERHHHRWERPGQRLLHRHGGDDRRPRPHGPQRPPRRRAQLGRSRSRTSSSPTTSAASSEAASGWYVQLQSPSDPNLQLAFEERDHARARPRHLGRDDAQLAEAIGEVISRLAPV